jgi:hypothetical protein
VVREGERESNLAAGCARARLVALSSDENVANRNASVVTLAPGFGRGRQKRVLERWTNHKLPRRACSPRYGLQSSPGVECRPRAPGMLVTTIRNFSGAVRAFDLRWGFKREFPLQVLGQWCDLLSPSQSPGPAPHGCTYHAGRAPPSQGGKTAHQANVYSVAHNGSKRVTLHTLPQRGSQRHQ